MKFVLILGPMAVGKMTVGQELAKLTDLKLFHNHMTIELVSNFFSYGSPQGKRLVGIFRKEIFEEVAKSDLYGIIFTYVCRFDVPEDWEYCQKLFQLFREHNGEVYVVELSAPLDKLLERNITENRLLHKPTKRNIEWSTKNLEEGCKKYRLNSNLGEIAEKNYIRIDNTNLSAEETAQIIKERFEL